jgi:hypothetical protein
VTCDRLIRVLAICRLRRPCRVFGLARLADPDRRGSVVREKEKVSNQSHRENMKNSRNSLADMDLKAFPWVRAGIAEANSRSLSGDRQASRRRCREGR